MTDSSNYEFCLNEVDKIIENKKSLKKINSYSNKEIYKPNEKIGEMNVKKEYYVEDKKTLRNENISLLTEDKKYNNCDYSSDSHILFQKGNAYGSIHPTNKFRNLKDFLAYNDISPKELRNSRIMIGNSNHVYLGSDPHRIDEKIREARIRGKNIRFRVFK